MRVKLATQVVHIEAPRELVFQMLSAIGNGKAPGESGEQSRVLERDGDRLIAEFFTPSGKRIYRTVEEIRLFRPERITFRHLNGPLHFSEEAFTLTEAGDSTDLTYTGEVGCRVPFMPGMGWFVSIFYVRPKYNALIRKHMQELKAAAEARAVRSHVFGRRSAGGASR